MTPAHPAGHPAAHSGGRPAISSNLDRDPIVIFWELTLACALACQHCRAKAQPKRHPNELDTEQCFRVMDDLNRFDTPPIVVLSGGDPFMRRDLFDIAEYGLKLGLTVSVSPSATALVTPERLKRLVDIGVQRVSFSLDSPLAAVHDEFRGFAGT
ncbi:MAG: radical SAM protein, partial [Chloroflexi bacterium]|nr:radical SAM protein [Chloroflexota bacterium]